MIYSAITHLVNQLNLFLKRSFDLSEDVVVMSNILEQDGTLAQNVGNKLVMSLINIEKESASTRPPSADSYMSTAASYPPLDLNLYVMVAANFGCGNYAESLKFLSNAIAFFQRQPCFDHATTPDLDKRISKLVLDIENLNIQDLTGLWGVLSGKYQPSILYKVRMVTFDAGDILTQLHPIKGHQAAVG